MKDQMRPTLWMVFITIIALLWFKWNDVNKPIAVKQNSDVAIPTQSTNISNNPNVGIPQSGEASAQVSNAELITVTTDLYEVSINPVGGNIVQVKLLTYPTAIGDDSPINLLESTPEQLFIMQSGLSSNQKDNATHRALFTSTGKDYKLTGEYIKVPLIWEKNGVKVEKTFTFNKGKFDFELSQVVSNNSGSYWNGYQYNQLKREKPKSSKGLATINTYTGAAYSTQEVNYEKLSFSNMDDKNLKIEGVEGGWIAMMQHYFIASLLPSANDKSTFYSTKLPDGAYNIGLLSSVKTIQNGGQETFKMTAYIGPKIKDDLGGLATNLDKAVDFGPLFFISDILFNFMNWVHKIVGNWGWSIVIATIVIKIGLSYFAVKSFKSMAKMRKFAPEMEKMRNNLKEDKQKLGQEMMKLYKKEGINPASGCLPILLQIPIFMAFYWMLMESVELRQAPWILWIQDLSIKDPLYVLPVINAVLMFMQQKLNPPPSDPTQRKVMMMLPIVFGIMFLWFPSGLVLYWTVSNSFSIVQQYMINKRYGAL